MTVIPAVFLLLVTSTLQGAEPQEPSQPALSPPVDTRPGQTASSSAGTTGQRQTREQLGQVAGIEPLARISGRIQNRTQMRVRNRIDRYYDPQANVISPFVVAGDQARAGGKRSK